MNLGKNKLGILSLAAVCAVSFSMMVFADEAKTAAPAAAAGPTDPQIAAIVVAANQVDIDAGNVGKKSKNKDVQNFAKLMMTDHSAVNKQAVELVTKLHVTPEANDTSKSLIEGGRANIANLNTLKGTAFDKAYIDHEVAYHQAVLNAVDKVLIPNAKNAELKALLVKVRPAFEAHLKHAQDMQASMSKAS